jgi:hypothetical protein
MTDENFSVEESAALLHAIFPNYPDIQGMKPAPEIGSFLRSLRAETPLVPAAVEPKPPMKRAS